MAGTSPRMTWEESTPWGCRIRTAPRCSRRSPFPIGSSPHPSSGEVARIAGEGQAHDPSALRATPPQRSWGGRINLGAALIPAESPAARSGWAAERHRLLPSSPRLGIELPAPSADRTGPALAQRIAACAPMIARKRALFALSRSNVPYPGVAHGEPRLGAPSARGLRPRDDPARRAPERRSDRA